MEGKYEISDDGNEITFTFESEDEDADEYAGTFDFEQGKDDEGDKYIKISGITYKEV